MKTIKLIRVSLLMFAVLLTLAACGATPPGTPVADLPTVAPTVAASLTPTDTPAPVPSATPTPTATSTPTPTATDTPTPTATPVPKVTIDGVGEVTQLEAGLFEKALSDYRHAYSLDADQPVSLVRETVRGLSGTTVDVATTPDGVPLMITNAETGEWQIATLRPIAELRNVAIAAPLKYQFLRQPAYAEMIVQNANKALITEDLSTSNVFRNFDRSTWQSVLDNWDGIQAELDAGNVPSGFRYDWGPSRAVVDFAREHGMSIKAQCLLFGSDQTDSVLNAGFSPEQLRKIKEFTVKTTILQYKGQIQEWDVADEAFSSIKYMEWNGDYGFWFRNLGGEQAIIDVAYWVKEADPSTKLVLTEDHVMEETFGNLQPDLNTSLFRFLERVRAEGIPIDGVDIENNLWIYNPPRKEYMTGILSRIAGLGFYISTPETTVIVSSEYPIWYETPATPIKVDDTLQAQADLYRITLEAYLEAGANAFGFGDISDNYSWYMYHGGTADAMVLDKANRPKLAYYVVLRTLFSYVSN